MVRIHHTSQGWNLVVSESLGYYSSLGDVMDAAYAASGFKGDHYAVSEVRDCSGNNGGSSTGG